MFPTDIEDSHKYKICSTISEPFVLTPFGTHDNWTAGVKGAHIDIQGSMEIVPHDQGSFDRRQEEIQLGEDSIAALFHIRELKCGRYH